MLKNKEKRQDFQGKCNTTVALTKS